MAFFSGIKSFFRFFFSNFILFAFLAYVGVGWWLYQNDVRLSSLFPQPPATLAEYEKQLEDKQVVTASSPATASEAGNVSPEAEVDAQATDNGSQEVVAESTDKTAVEPEFKPEASVADNATGAAESETATDEPAKESAGTEVVVADDTSAPEKPAIEIDVKKEWALARYAFMRQDYQKAEEKYLALIQYQADKPDSDMIGELGNVYYRQGKWLKAAESYHQTALLLLGTQRHQQALDLHRIISALDPERADQLATAMDAPVKS